MKGIKKLLNEIFIEGLRCDAAVAKFTDYISTETLAEKITVCDEIAGSTTIDVNGENVEVKVERI